MNRPLLSIITLLLTTLPVCAQVPQLMNYQGRIQTGTNNFEGTGQFKFALVSSGGPNARTVWRNDGRTESGEPATAISLPVNKGLYTILLGDTNKLNMAALPPSAFNGGEIYLRIWFSDGRNGFQQLTPDQRIAAVGYAMTAANVLDGAITADKLAPQSVRNEHLDDNAITEAKLSADSVGPGQIREGAVTRQHLDDNIGVWIRERSSGAARYVAENSAISLAYQDVAFHVQSPVSVTGQFESSSRQGTLLQLKNSSRGGEIWSVRSSGEDTTAGNLEFLVGDGNRRMYLRPNGWLNVHAGILAPTASFLHDAPGGTWLSLRNFAPGGQEWSLISTGPENSEGAGNLLFFSGADSERKMQLDRNGNLDVKGSVTARNSPAIKYSQQGALGAHHLFYPGAWHDIDIVNFKAPAAGYLFITAYATIGCAGVTGGGFEIGLDEGPANHRLTTINLVIPPTFSRQTGHLSWVLPVTEARTVLLKLVGVFGTTSGRDDAIAELGTHNLTVIYIPQLAE